MECALPECMPDPAEKTPPVDGGGEPTSATDLLPLVYDELRKLAADRMAREPGGGAGFTLNPTSLVHEAFVRLVEQGTVHWNGRGHFFGAAAQAMRRILVERARRHAQAKRGGGFARVPMTDLPATNDENAASDLLALDDALTELQAEEERCGQVVVLRYFAGLGVEETAEVLDIAPATVKRDWLYARAWLLDRMNSTAN